MVYFLYLYFLYLYFLYFNYDILYRGNWNKVIIYIKIFILNC